MKYIVENWLTEEIIKVFPSDEERQKWLLDNVNSFSDGGYLDDGTKISIYETVDIHDTLKEGRVHGNTSI